MGVWTPGPDATGGDDIFDGDGTNENADGLGGNDILNGGAGQDTLNGNDGDDTLRPGDDYNPDTIIGGDGYDILDYSLIREDGFFFAGGPADRRYAVDLGSRDSYSEIEEVWGSAASDWLQPFAAVQVVRGGGGNDVFWATAADQVFYGGAGGDFFRIASTSYTIEDFEVGADIFFGSAITAMTIDGDDTILNGVVRVVGVNTLSLAEWQAMVTGAFAFASSDAADFFPGTAADDWQFGGSQNDNLAGDSGDDTLLGGAGDDLLGGDDGADTIEGGSGDDFIVGSVGDDYLIGGTGADIVSGGDGDDTIVMSYADYAAGDAIAGDDGTDTLVNLSGSGVTPYYLISLGSIERLVFEQGAGGISRARFDAIQIGGGLSSALTIVGSDLTDTLYIQMDSSGFVTVAGFSFENWGGADGIYLTGADGADTIIGSSGYDQISGLGGDDTISGLGGNDALFGGDGDDVIAGGGGGDIIDGGAGFDVASYAGAATAVVASLASPGANTGQAAGDSYTSIEAMIGSSFNDTLTGDAGANVLDGGGGLGNDTLNGGGGADILIGGAGVDMLNGGAGIDTVDYAADAGGVTVNLATGEGFDGDGFLDTFVAIENVIGSAFADTLTGNAAANALSGGAGGDTLAGGAGDDVLDGGAGADAMEGGAGDDLYVVDSFSDSISELANEGVDTITARINFTLGANVEKLVLLTSANINGTGNALANVLTGNAGNNLLQGLAGADVLNGGDGNDTLIGGAGADTMRGGGGDDIFDIDSVNDVVVELSSQGVDQVNSRVTYTLGSNVENLTLLTPNNINGFGNSLDNVMTGNAGNNLLKAGNGNDTLIGGGGNDTLQGQGGADAMSGGAGDDTYYVDNVNDAVTELGGEGSDRVYARIDYSLGANVETLVLLGEADLDGVGNGLNNTVMGNAGDNQLEGRAGNDLINGGAGADILIGGSGEDAFVFGAPLGAGNVDTIADFSVADDTIRLKTSVFTEIGAGQLAANAFHIGASAADANDRIVYDSATGALYYDADGIGGAAQIQFATLAAGLALTNADFFGT